MRLALWIHLALVAIGLPNLSHGAERPPNIVFLLADDLGWTGLGCFGSDFYETPHLDALAASGLRFSNAYAACTVCSPTRASIMTGMYPARLHLTDFIAGQLQPFAKLRVPEWRKYLPTEQITIAEVLRDAGYRTAHIGKWHLSPRGEVVAGTEPTDQGFDVSHSQPPGTKGYFLPQDSLSQNGTNYLTDYLTDKACQFIRDSQSEPLFLYFGYNVPHTPIQGREDLVKYFTAKVNPEAIHNNPTYAAMVASLDESVGRLVKELEEANLIENTVIIFTSDNGGLTERNGKHDGFTENLPLRRGKGSAYEGGVRVPTIVRWPGVTPSNQVCHEPVMTIDYFSTIAEISGASHSLTPDGKSLVPLLRDPSHTLDRSLYWHYPHYHAGGDSPYSAIRRGDFRLIEFHEDHRVELYNLATDIGEQIDLAEAKPRVTQGLLDELHAWRASVGAQMPSANPDYDPARVEQSGRGRKGAR